MIALEFKKGQGLGNQLWNYVVLRKIAEKKGLEYKILNINNFKGKNFLEIEFTNTDRKFDIKLFDIYKEKLIFDNELECYVNDFDKNVFKIKKDTLIEGIFQSEEYLKPNIEIINKYIKIKKNLKKYENFKNTCILNIRGGEYKSHRNLILPKSYWVQAINNMKKFNPNLIFKIITDDYKYASCLLPKYEIIRGDIEKDFINLYNSKYLILSNSSFGYFPSKLGVKPKIVIAPNQWSRFGNKLNRWVSPSNFYKDWLWQNTNGEIIKDNEINSSILNSRKIYSTYNVSTCEQALKRFSLKDIFPKKFKKKVKSLLSNIFPLFIG